AIDLEGYSEVEFRRDRDGRAVLMEINARLSASVEIAVRAGIDYPLLVYRWATGESLGAPAAYRAGVRMRWLGGDIAWLAETWRSQGRPGVSTRGRALADFFGEFARRDRYDYVDRRDLKPAAIATAAAVARQFRRDHHSAGTPNREWEHVA